MFWRRWQVLETFFKQKSQRASKVCCFKNKLEITATIALFLLKHFSAPKCNPEGFLKARPSQYLGTWQCISTVRIQIYFFSGCSFFARFHPEFLLSLKFIIPPKRESYSDRFYACNKSILYVKYSSYTCLPYKQNGPTKK